MTYQNAQRKNIGNNEGDVLKFFQSKMRNLIAYNGGDHTFGWFTEDVDDKDAPMPVGTKTNKDKMDSCRSYNFTNGKEFCNS